MNYYKAIAFSGNEPYKLILFSFFLYFYCDILFIVTCVTKRSHHNILPLMIILELVYVLHFKLTILYTVLQIRVYVVKWSFKNACIFEWHNHMWCGAARNKKKNHVHYAKKCNIKRHSNVWQNILNNTAKWTESQD